MKTDNFYQTSCIEAKGGHFEHNLIWKLTWTRAADVAMAWLWLTINNISYSEKSDASNESDSIVNAFWYWLQSDERYLLFTRYMYSGLLNIERTAAQNNTMKPRSKEVAQQIKA